MSIDDTASFHYFLQSRGDEALTTEARVHAHQQDDIDLVEDIIQIRKARRRIKDKTSLTTVIADQLKRAVDVFGGFTMERDDVCACFGKHRNHCIDRFDHQMHIDGDGHMGANCFANQRTDRQIRDIMIVHDVKVDPVCAGCNHVTNFFTQACKVCGQNGRGNAAIGRWFGSTENGHNNLCRYEFKQCSNCKQLA